MNFKEFTYERPDLSGIKQHFRQTLKALNLQQL